jgi:hypothetical protein
MNNNWTSDHTFFSEVKFLNFQLQVFHEKNDHYKSELKQSKLSMNVLHYHIYLKIIETIMIICFYWEKQTFSSQISFSQRNFISKTLTILVARVVIPLMFAN